MFNSKNCKKEKSDRLHKVIDFVGTVHVLCAMFGMDFFITITEVHPSWNDSIGMQSKSISNDTLSRLVKTILALEEDKKQRLAKCSGSLVSPHMSRRLLTVISRYVPTE